MKMKKLLVGILLSVLVVATLTATAQEKEEDKKQSILGAITRGSYTKEMVLGNILSGALENMHLTKKKINDDLSEKAFGLYLERIDYGKQFLLEDEVEKLEKYDEEMDDQVKKGNLTIVAKSQEILKPRIKMLDKYVQDVLKKPFDFKKKEKYQTDPEKRKYAENIDDLKKRWKKLLKYETLNRMLEMKDEQEGKGDKKKKKKTAKKKKEKKEKLTLAQMEVKAREKVSKSYHKIFKRLTDEKRNDQLDKFYNSIARVYDPHTHYLIPEEKEDFDIDMSGQLQGIGALLREEGSYIKVERIIPGSASWRGKELKAEDIILAVGQGSEDPVDIVDMSLRDAVKLIRGPKGTEVRLTVKKPDGSKKVIPIIRDVVVIEESYAKSSVLEHTKLGLKIGYIHVPKFYRDFSGKTSKNCSEDVRQEIIKLKKYNVEGIVLDLRNNGGGALEDARIMSGLFIKKGPIVQVKAHTGAREVLKDTNPKIEFKKPLVVLVNRFSASASEILAAAMQDYGRAVIVGAGEQTHGKGTVQAVIDLDGYVSPMARAYSPLGALKITIQMFYRITGGSTQFKGVTPDIVLPDPYAYMDTGEKSLDHAIPYNEVRSVEFQKWDKYSYNISKLAKNSKARVKKSKKFQLINQSVEWLKERKEKSERTLNLDAMIADRELVQKKNDEFKDEKEFESMKVTTFIKVKDDVTKEKKEEFEKTLRKDPVLEETMHIFNDILKDKNYRVSKN
jgi:carboxyl-terminal processing protease